MARVAFIGLGTMGLPMARHLVAAGHDVVAYDLDRARAEALGASVGQIAKLCNNFVAGVTMAALAEAVYLGRRRAEPGE